jgi:ribosomal protein S18 acetylase RimI-like enzyme
MSEILQDLSAPALVTTIDVNFFDCMRLFGCSPQTEVHIGQDIQWVITGLPLAGFNFVGRAKLAPDDVDATVEAVKARCQARNVPMIWKVAPDTRPADLGAHLERHGFVHVGDSPGMAADLLTLNEDAQTPPNLIIEQVGDTASLRQWTRAAIVGFGFPDSIKDDWFDMMMCIGFGAELPLRYYIGWQNSEVVATSMMFLGAGVAGIYTVGTLPEARRQGIGTAMTLVPLREARALGYRVGVLESSKLGFGVYQKIGFREYCKTGVYVWKPETEQEG